MTLSDVISSKTRNQILTGTSIAFVVAILTIDMYSSFKLSEASLDNQGNTTTTNATGATGIPVGNTPFYSEHITVTGQNPINASLLQASLSGKGNLTLPNSTQTIAVNSIGSALVNFKTTSAIVHEFLTADTEDEGGSENASVTIYEITRHDVKTRTEKGVVTAIFETNSTGQLAFLDGMIAVGQADVDAAGNTNITLLEFETGIPEYHM